MGLTTFTATGAKITSTDASIVSRSISTFSPPPITSSVSGNPLTASFSMYNSTIGTRSNKGFSTTSDGYTFVLVPRSTSNGVELSVDIWNSTTKVGYIRPNIPYRLLVNDSSFFDVNIQRSFRKQPINSTNLLFNPGITFDGDFLTLPTEFPASTKCIGINFVRDQFDAILNYKKSIWWQYDVARNIPIFLYINDLEAYDIQASIIAEDDGTNSNLYISCTSRLEITGSIYHDPVNIQATKMYSCTPVVLKLVVPKSGTYTGQTFNPISWSYATTLIDDTSLRELFCKYPSKINSSISTSPQTELWNYYGMCGTLKLEEFIGRPTVQAGIFIPVVNGAAADIELAGTVAYCISYYGIYLNGVPVQFPEFIPINFADNQFVYSSFKYNLTDYHSRYHSVSIAKNGAKILATVSGTDIVNSKNIVSTNLILLDTNTNELLLQLKLLLAKYVIPAPKDDTFMIAVFEKQFSLDVLFIFLFPTLDSTFYNNWPTVNVGVVRKQAYLSDLLGSNRGITTLINSMTYPLKESRANYTPRTSTPVELFMETMDAISYFDITRIQSLRYMFYLSQVGSDCGEFSVYTISNDFGSQPSLLQTYRFSFSQTSKALTSINDVNKYEWITSIRDNYDDDIKSRLVVNLAEKELENYYIESIWDGPITISTSGVVTWWGGDEGTTGYNGVNVDVRIYNCSGLFTQGPVTINSISNGKVPLDFSKTRPDIKYTYGLTNDLSTFSSNGYWLTFDTLAVFTLKYNDIDLIKYYQNPVALGYDSDGLFDFNIGTQLDFQKLKEETGLDYKDSGFSINTSWSLDIKNIFNSTIAYGTGSLILSAPTLSGSITASNYKNSAQSYETFSFARGISPYVTWLSDIEVKKYPDQFLFYPTLASTGAVIKEIKDNTTTTGSLSASLKNVNKGEKLYITYRTKLGSRFEQHETDKITMTYGHKYTIDNVTISGDSTDITDQISKGNPYIYINTGSSSTIGIEFDMDHEDWEEVHEDYNTYPTISNVYLMAITPIPNPSINLDNFIAYKQIDSTQAKTYPNHRYDYGDYLKNIYTNGLVGHTKFTSTVAIASNTTSLLGQTLSVAITQPGKYQLYLLVKDENSRYSCFCLTNINKNFNIPFDE